MQAHKETRHPEKRHLLGEHHVVQEVHAQAAVFFFGIGAQPALFARLDPASPLIDAGDPTILDPDGSRSDIGIYGGPAAGGWDQDFDGFFEWWQPGDYDSTDYPALGWDCDDRDEDLYPDSGC